MKKILDSKKLAAYSLLSASFVAAKHSDGKIIYTDINPDHTVTANDDAALYYIDLNKDGKADLRISIISFTGSEFYDAKYRAFPGSSVKLVHGRYGGFISALSSSFRVQKTLSNSLKWNRHHDLEVHFYDVWGTDNYAGPWFEQRGVERYIGFVIRKNGANYYGWLRCMIVLPTNWGEGASMIFFDYAINMTPNASIKTGQIDDDGTMLKEALSRDMSAENVDISVFTMNKSVQIKLNDEHLLNSLLTIYNLKGQPVYSEKINQLCLSVELPQLPDGVYLLNLNSEYKRKTYKIYLKK